jgi:hypothetical protein
VSSGPNPELIKQVLPQLDTLCEEMPRDERPWYYRGDLAVRLHDLRIAEESLHRCLSLLSQPHLTPMRRQIRASALYDLACVYARTGRLSSCRRILLESNNLQPLDGKWLRRDPDLRPLRRCAWFHQLCRLPLRRKPVLHGRADLFRLRHRRLRRIG